MSIEMSNETEYPVDETRIYNLAVYAMDRMRLHPNTDLYIRFVDLETMEELHIRHMDEPGATDVLSFPMDELLPGDNLSVAPEGILGDIVICPEFAAAQAEKAGHPAINEMLLLTTHGILHLLGFRHSKKMFSLQDTVSEAYAQ